MTDFEFELRRKFKYFIDYSVNFNKLTLTSLMNLHVVVIW